MRLAAARSGWQDVSGCAIVKRISGEEAARASLADVPLRLVVGLGRGDADGVEAEVSAARSSSAVRHANPSELPRS